MTKALVFVLLAITAVCWGQRRKFLEFGKIVDDYDELLEGKMKKTTRYLNREGAER